MNPKYGYNLTRGGEGNLKYIMKKSYHYGKQD